MLKAYLQHIDINVAFVSNASSYDEYKFHHSNLDYSRVPLVYIIDVHQG